MSRSTKAWEEFEVSADSLVDCNQSCGKRSRTRKVGLSLVMQGPECQDQELWHGAGNLGRQLSGTFSPHS